MTTMDVNGYNMSLPYRSIKNRLKASIFTFDQYFQAYEKDKFAVVSSLIFFFLFFQRQIYILTRAVRHLVTAIWWFQAASLSNHIFFSILSMCMMTTCLVERGHCSFVSDGDLLNYFLSLDFLPQLSADWGLHILSLFVNCAVEMIK